MNQGRRSFLKALAVLTSAPFIPALEYIKEHKPTFLNVRWFGAKGDGVTDDTAAIQAAMEYRRRYREAFPLPHKIFNTTERKQNG